MSLLYFRKGDNKELMEMTKDIINNMDSLNLDKYDEEDSDLVFTSELKMLKNQEGD